MPTCDSDSLTLIMSHLLTWKWLYKWQSQAKNRKNPVLRVRLTQIFHFVCLFFVFVCFLVCLFLFLFVFFSFLKSFKISCFWQKSKKFGGKYLKIILNIFQKFFCKKKSDFWEIFVFVRSFLPPEWKKKILEKNVLTDWPYLDSPSARKTGFLFFVALGDIFHLQSISSGGSLIEIQKQQEF